MTATTRFETLNFSVQIKAPCAKVYQLMLDEQGYRQWTQPFHPTSHYVGSWQTGQELHFIALDDGVPCGMLSRVLVNQPAERVTLEHIGILDRGEAIYSSEKVAAFAGARETYVFTPNDDGCLLQIEMDTSTEWRDYFLTSWPAALTALQQLCEQS